MESNLKEFAKKEQKTRIVLYEDDTEISYMCKLILEKENYLVTTSPKCVDVIQDIEVLQPDLILMDLWIPEIGGETAVNQVKSNPATQHIPILLFSANSEIEEICSRCKADGYISKPFDIHTLTETIHKFISARKTK